MKMINNAERIAEMSAHEYQEIFGIQKETFDKSLEILETEYAKKHEQGGRTPRLTVLDQLVITIGYLREYRAMKHLAFDYRVGKTQIHNAIKWVEDTLVKSGTFSLPSRRVLENYDNEIEVIVIDDTEQEIERPKRGKKNGIPGRKSDTQSKRKS